MPRTITIHPLSLAVGLVFGGLCLLSMSQVTVSTPLRVEYLAHPRDMVQIREGAPFVVPAGKLFVLTALGSTYNNGCVAASLTVNGQTEVGAFFGGCTGGFDGGSIVPIAAGFTVAAGSTVEPMYNGAGRAWGYLANQ